MRSVFIVALLVSRLLSVVSMEVVLMQSRLRGSKTSDSIEDKVVLKKDTGRSYSDDDESCTTEGLSPGVCALSSLARPLASKRLRKSVADCDEKESRDRLERALLAEIEAALSGNHSAFGHQRLQELEKELRPLYVTLPHEVPLADLEGGLGLSSARHLLHQYFLRRHSWQVRGLNPAGDGRAPPDHQEALRSAVAGHLLELLERKVGAQGLNLKTLAVFVATLEHLLHGDERERLKQSWSVHDLKQEDLTDAEGLQSVLEVFMAHFVYSSQKSQSGYALTLAKGLAEVSFVSRVYDGWSKIQEQIRQGIQKLHQNSPGATDLSFDDAVRVADQVLEYFRDVSGSMCRDMAEVLGQMPGGKQGKVPLKEMRKQDLFRETVDYLRAANALDESGREPLVLVPNYMLSPSNCDGTTSFYDLCCPDPCEGQRASFEEARMEGRAIDFMEQLAEEQGAPRHILPKLHELLERQADLHGHEFSVWLHEAFPHRCPRPATSNAERPEFQKTAQVESLFEW